MTAMADKTFSIYVKNEALYNRARELEKEGKLLVRDVCNEAIQQAVKAVDGGSVPVLDLSSPEDAQVLADDASNIEYTLQYQPNLPATQSMIDNVRDQGGWTIGFSKDPVDTGFWVLFGNPRVLNGD